MVGSMESAALGHLARRGLRAAHGHFSGMNPTLFEKLQSDAKLYEAAGPEMEMKPREFLPVAITAIIVLVLMASVRYTLGNVMASLAMIESPSTTAIIESSPPAYKEEVSEKEAPLDADRDVEIMVIQNKPITAKISTTIGHLQRTGGFAARWRGLGFAIFYHALHGLTANTLAGLLGLGVFGHAFTYIFASLSLARVHMAWTHKMITTPSTMAWNKRFIPRKQCKAILLPTLVFSVAQQVTVILPIAVAFALGIPQKLHNAHVAGKMPMMCPADMLKLAAVPATALFVAITILLPAAVTLTRIEAALLPNDQETIVPFDRSSVIGELDMSARGSAKKVFVQAWRSFDRAARLRLIKLYAKLVFVQVTIAGVGMVAMATEVAMIGGDRLALFVKSGGAQLQLAIAEAHGHGGN
ncbi:hypothetical protein B0A48_08367 [Cryoendolithus antarcticus]|uniref:Uncharacterized protein n=1 Tax=Cryoendolithus antarcticus TaxID=1507870 RepID=A0A1V8T589_9PEZI|nr:hypothetical protein B0A48_08367 [Cryoendolithus antarcticus]